jgi:coenzyme F420-reducing hydrogenase gamma subunit
MAIVQALEIVYFAEAGSRLLPGPYDVSFVEGSVSTPEEVEKIRKIREDSRYVVAIGACATAGGIQALRNGLSLEALKSAVYPAPEVVEALPTSTPISAHIRVDLELQGCPISKDQLLQTIASLLRGKIPLLPGYPVCIDCKQKGNVCVVVRDRVPCMGPVTRTGCGVLCPTYGRGCYGCFGPSDNPQIGAFQILMEEVGLTPEEMVLEYGKFNVGSHPFQKGIALARGEGRHEP